MRKNHILRPVLSGLSASASLAGLAGGVLFVAPEAADAQGTQPSKAPGGQPSQSELPSTVHRFDIAPAPFTNVVGAFERATGIQVTLAIDSIGSIQSPGVSGSFTAERALRAMVAGTGIRFRVTSPTGAILELIPNAQSVEVTESNALQTTTDLSRLPDTLQSTPQTVVVIPQVMIEQQQATTVDQVLQYVPGITVSTGEGNGGVNGDQFRIRGFDASGDIYVDGLRDFGSYVRDSFATESVMVIKGPSSQSFGNGTTGGVIELGSKKAHLGNSESFEATGGTGPYGRGVLDVNRQLNGTTAVRIVAMGNGQDIVDRDHVYSNRFGFLGSIGFGLGTKQTVTLNYFHQHSDARPDFGIPTGSFGASSGGISEPLTEFGLPRSNYYGRSSDHDLMDADVATVRYKREIGEWLTLSNDTRFGHYTRDLAFTPSFCLNFPAATAAAYGLAPSNCASDVAAGNLDTAYTRWPVGGFKLASYGAENVTAALMQFKTAGLRNELMAGVDVYYQHQQANFYSPTGSGPAGTLLDPIFQNPPGFSLNLAASGTTAHSWDAGPFVSDRLWLLTKLSILAGVRFDHYQVDGVNAGALITPTTNFTSPKAALIWEPTKQQTYYFSYGRSFTPPGNNITTLGSSLSLAGGAALSNTKPESATNYEVGGKWTLLKDRLGATAALFRVNRGNAIYTDPTSGIQSLTDDRVRVQGVELGLTGKITPAWDVQASYSYSDSKIIYTSTASAIGNQVPYVSKNGIGLWTTYDLAPLFREFPGHLLVGGGINYRSDYYLNDTLTLRIPDATTLDAIVSYDLHRYHLAFNVKNLTNELAYSQAFGNGYATPVPGRTFLFTIGTRF